MTPTAPFIRPQPGALPPPTRPLELPPPREPVLRTWHMPGPAEPPREEPPTPAEAGDATERAEVPWEIEAMTSPEYKAPRSIHDPEHDSWPVAAPDGTATPAWPDEQEVELELTDAVEAEPAPMELTDVVSADEADRAIQLDLADVVDTEAPAATPRDTPEAETGAPVDVPYVESGREPGTTFPLDAFIVPSGVEHVPAGYLEEMSGVVAERLEALAQQIRREGIQSVGKADDADELAHVLAAIVAGYLARRA